MANVKLSIGATKTVRRKVAAFRRYTNLAAAIHLLQTKQITLLSPASWDDKNDSYFMAEYKRLLGFNTVLALCFAEASETYHHWRVFSPGADGVCIEFEKEKLLSMFRGNSGVRVGRVKYPVIGTLRKRSRIEIKELPFLKRRAYKDEREHRAVYTEENRVELFREFEIDLGWVKRITLSPWLSPALRDSVATTLKAIPGCAGIKIARSTLIGNNEWRSFTAKAK